MNVYDISNNFKEVRNDWSIGTNYYWITCDAKEISLIQNKMQLNKDCIEECKNLKQFAKISYFDTYLFIVFNILEFHDEEIVSKELNIFLGKDYIITIFKDNSIIIDELINDVKELKNCLILKDIPRPCIMLYYILDRIILRNYNIISDLEAHADYIEISILRKPEESQARELINLRRQVYKARKFLNPLRYIGDSLITNDNGVIEIEYIKYFEIINIKIGKLMQAQENLVQDLALVREAFEAEIANKTNQLIKIFTLVAAIFLPLNLITGLFSMSFDYMPLAKHFYGYHIIISSMMAIVLFMLYLFKRKKWL